MQVSMISLGVTDVARSSAFYTETLGMPSAGGGGEVMLVQGGGVMLVLNGPLAKAGGPIVGAVEIVFAADSVTARHDELKAKGCSFVNEPREVMAGNWAATFTDPDGHRLTLFGPK